MLGFFENCLNIGGVKYLLRCVTLPQMQIKSLWTIKFCVSEVFSWSSDLVQNILIYDIKPNFYFLAVRTFKVCNVLHNILYIVRS